VNLGAKKSTTSNKSDDRFLVVKSLKYFENPEEAA